MAFGGRSPHAGSGVHGPFWPGCSSGPYDPTAQWRRQ